MPITETRQSVFRSEFVTVGGHCLHVKVADAAAYAPPLVMVHGVIVSHRYLMPTAELLAERFRVHVPDLPGHGYSSKPISALSPSEQADVLYEYGRQNDLLPMHLFGNSYGCQIIAHLGRKYPDAVNKIVMAAPTIDPRAPTLFEQALLLFADAFSERPSVGLVVMRDIFDMGVRRALQTCSEMMRDDIREQLPHVTAETLLLRGTKDLIVSAGWLDQLAEITPNRKVLELPGAPHDVNYSSPHALANATTEFLFE